MPVVIRLMRAGAKKRPFYRMVVADSRRQRDGRFIEILGHYDPLVQPHKLAIEKDRVESWIALGARPSEQAASLLRTQGIRVANRARAGKKTSKTAGAAKSAKKRTARKPRALSARKVKARATRKAGPKKKPAAKAEKSFPAQWDPKLGIHVT